jgi:hypothetical protein
MSELMILAKLLLKYQRQQSQADSKQSSGFLQPKGILASKGARGVIILENVTLHSTYFEPKRETERVKGECEMV